MYSTFIIINQKPSWKAMMVYIFCSFSTHLGEIAETIMLTLNAIQSVLSSIKFGVSIDNAMAQAIIDNPVNFETVVPKGNIKGSACPAVSIAKGFDIEKPSYLGIYVNDGYLNVSLTNNKPASVDKGAIATEFTKLVSTRYDGKEAETQLKKVISLLAETHK